MEVECNFIAIIKWRRLAPVGFPVLAEKAERFGSYVGAIWLNKTFISVRLADPSAREREREEA